MPDGVTLQFNENSTLNKSIISLLPVLFAFKNPAFQEELEWRGGNFIGMMGRPDVEAVSVEDEETLKKRRMEESAWNLHTMDYRAFADRIVPYRSFRLDTKMGVIREVVLGPRNITPILVAQEALRRYGWKNVSVRKSTASYR